MTTIKKIVSCTLPLVFLGNAFGIQQYNWAPQAACSSGAPGATNQGTNWSPNLSDLNNAFLYFPPSVTPACYYVYVNNAPGTVTVGPWDVLGAYTFTGDTLVFPSGSTLFTFGAQSATINVGGITLPSGATWQIQGASPASKVTANISGAGTLQITSSSFIVGGDNSSFTGPILIGGTASATLQAASGLAITDSPITFSSGSILDLSVGNYPATVTNLTETSSGTSTIKLGSAILTVDTASSVSYAGTITGSSGQIVLKGGGTLTLSGNNGNFLNGIITANDGTITGTGANPLGAGATLTADSSGTIDMTGVTAPYSANQINVQDMGTIALGTRTLTVTQGGTIVSGGAVTGSSGSSITLTGGTLTWGGTPGYSEEVTIGAGATLTLTGGTTGSFSELQFGGTKASGSLQAKTADLTVDCPVQMNTPGPVTIDTTYKDITFGSMTATIGTAGVKIDQIGTGTWNVGPQLNISEAIINVNGTLQVGNIAYGLGNAGAAASVNLAQSGATLALGTEDLEVSNLTGMPGSVTDLGAQTLTIYNAPSNTAYYGVVNGTAGMANLIINKGTFSCGTANALNFGGSVTLDNGAFLQTLDLGTDAGEVSSIIYGAGGGTLVLGNQPTLSFAGDISLSGAGVLDPNGTSVDLSGGTISGAGQTFSLSGQGSLTLPSSVTLEILEVNNGTAILPADLTSFTVDTIECGPNSCGHIEYPHSDMTPTASYSGIVDLAQDGYFITDADSTLTLAGKVTGTNKLLVDGPGILVISSAINDYQGATVIQQGTLEAGAASVIPSGTSANPGQLAFYGTASDTSRIFQFPAGGANPFQAPQGTNPPTPISFVNSGTLNTPTGSYTFAGIIQSSTPAADPDNYFAKAGTGTLILSGENTYAIPTNITDGTLQAGIATSGTSYGAFGVGSAVTITTGATLSLGSSGTYYNNTIGSLVGGSGNAGSVVLGTATLTIGSGDSQTFSGVISGAGGVILKAGTLTLSGANTFSGSTTEIQSGATLTSGAAATVGTSGPFGNGATVTVDSGGTLNLNGHASAVGSLAGAGTVTFTSSELLTITNGSTSYTGAISGSGAITVSGGTQTFGGLNTYSGATTISGGATLQAGLANAFSPNSAYTISGTLALNGYNNSIKTISGSGVVSLGGSSILTLTSDNTFAGQITQTGGLKLAAGLTLSGTSNTYSGTTTIQNTGTLTAGGSNTFSPNTAVTVNTGGNLEDSTYSNTVLSLSNSGTVDILEGGTLAATNSFTQISAGTLALTGTSSTDPGKITSTGLLTLDGTLTVTASSTPSDSTQWVLMSSSGSGKQISNQFSSTNLPAHTVLNYYPGTGGPYTNSVVLTFAGSSACTSTWVGTSGSWDALANWEGGTCIPGTSTTSDTATFPDISGSSSVAVHVTTTGGGSFTPELWQLILTSDSTNYTFNGVSGSGLTFVSNGQDPQIIVSGPVSSTSYPTHTINVPITLSANTTFSFTEGILSLSDQSGISGPSYDVTVVEGTGEGIGGLYNDATININDLYIYGSGLTNSGTIDSASLTVEGDIGILKSAAFINGYNGTGTVTTGAITIGSSGDSYLLNSTEITSSGTVTIATSSGGITEFLNSGTFETTDAITISNSGTQSVLNSGTFSADLGISISGGTFENSKTVAAGGAISISGGTVSNGSGGSIAGDSFSVTDGTISNDQTSTLGYSGGSFSFTGGSIENAGAIVATTYTQGSGATLQMDLTSPASYGQVIGSGAADLDGTLVLNALSGFNPTVGSQFDLVQSGTLDDTQFANVEYLNFPKYISPSVNYFSNVVQLYIGEGSVPQVTPSPNGSFAGTALHVADAASQHNFFTLYRCSQLRSRFAKKSSPATDISSLEDQLQASNDLLSQAEGIQKREQLNIALREPSEQPGKVYVGPISSFGSISKTHDQPGVGYNSYGVRAGGDYAFSKYMQEKPVDFGLGLFVDYAYYNAEIDHSGGSSRSQSIGSTLYGSVVPTALRQLAFDGIVGFAHFWTKQHRTTGQNNDRSATSSPELNLFSSIFGTEFTFDSSIIRSMPAHFTFTPLIDLQYYFAHQQSYTEKGAGIYDLSVKATTLQSLSTFLAVRFDYDLIRPTYDVAFELLSGWRREYLSQNLEIPFAVIGALDDPLTSTAFGPGYNSAFVGVDILATIGRYFQVETTLDLQINNKFYNASFYLGFGSKF